MTLLAVSRAPLDRIEAFKLRMGWRFKWVSSHGSDFNYDFHVSFTEEERAKGRIYYNYAWRDMDADELSGITVFVKDDAGRSITPTRPLPGATNLCWAPTIISIWCRKGEPRPVPGTI